MAPVAVLQADPANRNVAGPEIGVPAVREVGRTAATDVVENDIGRNLNPMTALACAGASAMNACWTVSAIGSARRFRLRRLV